MRPKDEINQSMVVIRQSASIDKPRQLSTLDNHSKSVKLPRMQMTENRFSKAKYIQKKPIARLQLPKESPVQLPVPNTPVVNFNLGELSRCTDLQFENYEDDTLQRYSDEQIIGLLANGPIRIQILEQSVFGQWFWYSGQLIAHTEIFHYRRKGHEGRCRRIHFVCHFEDVALYEKKLSAAIQLRDLHHNLIKYQSYIANMPTKDLRQLTFKQMQRITQGKSLPPDICQFIKELHEYAQNMVIFNAYLQKTELVPHLKPFAIIQKVEPKVFKFNYRITIYSQGKLEQSSVCSYKQLRTQFQLSCFFLNQKVMKCLRELNQLIYTIKGYDIFQYSLLPIHKVKYGQEAQIKVIGSILKNTKLPEFTQSADNVRTILNSNQNERFFQLIRSRLQEGISEFIKLNIEKFINHLKKHCPADVIINSNNQIQNIYLSTKEHSNQPIFSVRMTIEKDEILYSFQPKTFQTIIASCIERAIEEFSNLHDPEQLIFNNHYKYQSAYLKLNEDVNIPDIEEINSIVRKSLADYWQQFAIFEFGFTYQSIEATQKSIEKHISQIHYLKKIASEIIQIPCSVQVGMFIVELDELKDYLTEIYRQYEDQGKLQLAQMFRERSDAIIKEFDGIQTSVKQFPTDIEKLIEKRDYLTNVLPFICAQKYLDIAVCVFAYSQLEELQSLIRKDDMNNYLKLIATESKMSRLIQQQIDLLDNQQKDLLYYQQQEQKLFQKDIQDLTDQFNKFKQIQSGDDFGEASYEMKQISKTIQKYKTQAQIYNRREELFGEHLTQYSVNKLEQEFTPYQYLWSVYSTFHSNINHWMRDNFSKIDVALCQSFMSDQYRLLILSIQQFKDQAPEMLNLSLQLKTEIEDFKQYVPVLVSLNTKGIKHRHLKELMQLMGKQIDVDSLSLQYLIDIGVMRYVEKCQEIGYKAQQEYHIEQLLDKIASQWEVLRFNQKPFKNSHILQVEEVFHIIDENLIQIQQMMQSKFNAPFLDQLKAWQINIQQISNFIEEWVRLQNQWVYFYPIFESPDINQQLKIEQKKFKQVDKYYQEIVHQNTTVYEFGMQNTVKIVDCNNKLDAILKELNNYLERKRERFSRLYFLSNEDFLEMLSRVQDPKSIYNLNKMFQSISALGFHVQNISTIIGVNETLKINQFSPYGKGIEEWLLLLEQYMKEGVNQSFKKNDTIQSLLVNNQIKYTILIDQLKQEVLPQILNHIERAVKAKQTSLIIQLVHYKDILQNFNEFQWQVQLRCYQEQKIQIRCFNVQYEYGYEYISDCARLIITPLTDKCNLTFVNALSLQKACAAIGPTGTGKSETIKDLARTMGRFCIVFNCSPQLDYVMIGKYLKGLAGSGAWCCFDEFNRISVEVMSIMSSRLQQLLTIRGETHFDGSYLNVQDFGVFITMNPSYQGRNELPENLKCLFRYVVLSQPQSQIIIEVLLYSQGFKHASQLSKQIITTFQISSELLSSQIQYDFSLRAIKSIVSINHNNHETIAILQALRAQFIPKLISTDAAIFQNILEDIFGKNARNIAIENDWLTAKTNELDELIRIRHGVMVIGHSGSGKTRVINRVCSKNQIEAKIIYPQAMTVDELFGSVSPQSLEWNEGLLLQFLHGWLIFDGDCNSNWIESLNTVLDESRRLCLANGQVIHVQDLKLIFETDSLGSTTPATISRCGIVYVSEQQQKYESHFETILARFNLQQHSNFLYYQYKSLLKNFQLNEYAEAFCLSRTFLSFVDDHTALDQLVKQLFQLRLVDSIFNYQLNEGILRLVDVPLISPALQFHQVTIQTKQSHVMNSLSQDLLKTGYHVIIHGEQALGKTKQAEYIINSFPYVKLSFARYMSAKETQNILESRLVKRRKDVLGPEINERMIFFIDDLNEPSELIRQFIEQRSWYRKRTLVHIEDTSVIATVPKIQLNRLTRHFLHLKLLPGNFIPALAQFFNQQIPKYVYDTLAKFKQMYKPTPLKMHYQFSMRDVWRILQAKGNTQFEMARTFGDRLLDQEQESSTWYCDFVNGIHADRVYRQITNMNVKDLFDKFNLPVYEQLIHNLIRVQRVIKLPEGHAIIIGQQNSGKRTLARMAAYIEHHRYPQIESSEDLRMNLKQAICDDHKLSVITNDVSMISLMNFSDLDLFTTQDLEQLLQSVQIECTSLGLAHSNLNLRRQVAIRERNNIHVIMCLTPAQLRSNKYFAKHSIIWLQQLPDQALMNIAKYQIPEQSPEMFRLLHRQAQLFGAYSQVHFMEMLGHFQRIFNQKDQETSQKISRIEQGLHKLNIANEQIIIMQKEMEEMEPQLADATRLRAEMLKRLQYEKQRLETQEIQLRVDETEAMQQQKEASHLAYKAEESVKEINQILDATLEQVQKLKKEHLVEIKSLGSPPKPVIIILSGVVILNLESLRARGGDILQTLVEGSVSKKEDNYFETAKKYFLNDPKELLKSLKNYDKNNINPYHINRLEKLVISDPEFTQERAKQCSSAVKYLYSWVRAMYDYNKVYIETRPLREQLQQFQIQLQQKTILLAEKNEQLRDVSARVQQLESEVNEQQYQQRVLMDQMEQCKLKLARAKSLTSGLAGENLRWSRDINELKELRQYLQIDSAVAAAFITYCGPISSNQRNNLLSKWGNYRQSPSELLKLTDNEILLKYSQKNCFCIDPQNQVAKILGKTVTIVNGVDMKAIEVAYTIKQPILIQNVNTIPYLKPNVKVYLTSMQQTVQLPEDQIASFKVINFALSQESMTEATLDLIVELENPILFKQGHELKIQLIECIDNLALIEESILEKLSVQVDELLSDEILINQLNNSEKVSSRIQAQKNEILDMQSKVRESRSEFKYLSDRIVKLYTLMQILHRLDSLYQFSIDWFYLLLRKAVAKVTEFHDRTKIIDHTFRQEFLRGLSRSLQDRHFFILQVLMLELPFSEDDWKFLIAEPIIREQQQDIPWLDKLTTNKVISELQLLQLTACRTILQDLAVAKAFLLSKSYDSNLIPLKKQLTVVHQLMIIKALRPDYLSTALEQLIEVQVFDHQLETCYQESEDQKVIVLVTNSLTQFQEFAKAKNFKNKYTMISMGQGQGPRAERIIREAAIEGLWVVLQNCHLCPTWMNDLDRLSQIEAHQDYRLWVTCASGNVLPSRMLQKAVKMVVKNKPKSTEGPKHVCLFHNALLERQNYRSLGFNIVYDFTNDDFEMAASQVNEYMCSNIHYGGKVIDPLDQRVLTLLAHYIFRDVEFQQFADNAHVQVNLEENSLLAADFRLLSQQKAKHQELTPIVRQIKNCVPEQLDTAILYEDPFMNILKQEISSFNQLIEIIKSDLNSLDRLLEGDDNGINYDDLLQQRVPNNWLTYLTSSKPLGSWLQDLQLRCNYLEKWRFRRQNTFSLWGFQFPKAIFSMNKLLYCRSMNFEYSDVEVSYQILDVKESDISSYPDKGIYIDGLRLEGAAIRSQKLCESETLSFALGVIYVSFDRQRNYYHCPLYQADRQNLVTMIKLNTPTPDIWILRGVAAMII